MRKIYSEPQSEIVNMKFPKSIKNNVPVKIHLKLKCIVNNALPATICFSFSKKVEVTAHESEGVKPVAYQRGQNIWNEEFQRNMISKFQVLEFEVDKLKKGDSKTVEFEMSTSDPGDMIMTWRVTHKNPWNDALVSYPDTTSDQ